MSHSSRKHLHWCWLVFALSLGMVGLAPCRITADEPKPPRRPPNVVLIFTDDQGYGDVGVYGAKDFETPNIDRLAKEGIRFSSFYVPQAVCSASRAGLLTGNYPNRIGILGALNPNTKHGIHADEMTLGEVFKSKGYATAIYGKWHLGHLPEFLPTRHGFDEYYGLPYSNDMVPKEVPLFENEKILERGPDQSKLTTSYTERAVKFIDKHKDKPFFVYMPHTMPHVPLFVSDKFKGKSKKGLHGDVLMEIDWSVGQILDTLKKHGLEENTLVMFTCDNGPWLSYGNHGGSAGPLREGKGTSFEGGVRVPFIARWPAQIPAGKVCHEPAMTIDILPTMAKLIGAELPKHKIDGLDIMPLLKGDPKAKSPHDAFFFYWGRELQAVRGGKWKLHFPHDYRSLTGKPGLDGRPAGYTTAKIELSLFDLENDVGEKTSVADKHPEVVERLKKLADQAREDLGDTVTKQPGKGVRPAGMSGG